LSLTAASFTSNAILLENTSGTSSGTNIGTPNVSGKNTAQYYIIKVSSLAANVTITAPSLSKSYLVINADSTYSVTIKAASQTGVAVVAGEKAIVVYNGTDYVKTTSSISAITSDTSSATPQYITFAAANSGYQGLKASSALRFVPSTGNLSVSGSISSTGDITVSGNVTASGSMSVIGGISTAGDVIVYRSATPTTGYIFLGNSGTRYLGYDGTSYYLSSAALTVGGNVTAYSDERVKTNWRGFDADFVARLAQVKSGVYDRTDIEETQVGVSAQSLQAVLPNAVMTDKEGMLSVAYGNAALAACVELAKRVVDLEARLIALEG
jgi:hypothetical protein